MSGALKALSIERQGNNKSNENKMDIERPVMTRSKLNTLETKLVSNDKQETQMEPSMDNPRRAFHNERYHIRRYSRNMLRDSRLSLTKIMAIN